jgi:integrase
MYEYLKLIKSIYFLLDDIDLLSLGDFQLCSLFEQVQELKGDNKSTNSALLNLFTYLDDNHGKSLTKMNLVIISTENIDKNLIWAWEVEAIINSDELSETDKLYILTQYECGTRNTETYQLIGEDIDIVGELLHFRTNRLGKMKNRYSTRYFPINYLSHELALRLLSNVNGLKNAIFDFDSAEKKQCDFRRFCMRMNAIIKKITGRNVSLKHLRHSRARIKYLEIKNEISLRSFYQNAGNMGHSNLLTGQRNYIQSVHEENILIGMSNNETAAWMGITKEDLSQQRCRYRAKNKSNKMSNEMLNTFLYIKHIKK